MIAATALNDLGELERAYIVNVFINILAGIGEVQLIVEIHLSRFNLLAYDRIGHAVQINRRGILQQDSSTSGRNGKS